MKMKSKYSIGEPKHNNLESISKQMDIEPNTPEAHILELKQLEFEILTDLRQEIIGLCNWINCRLYELYK